jgi:hypothetical protein
MVKARFNRRLSAGEVDGIRPPSTPVMVARRTGRVAAAALVAAAISGPGALYPVRASADPIDVGGDYSVNGIFTATSDGQWAKTREQFHDEATVVSTWTITSTCSTPYACTGQVTSDQGWSASTTMLSGMWYVSRDLENWMPCADGTFAPGHQIFRFYREDPNTLVGADKTVGLSGACGKNLPLAIELPFTLKKMD